VTISRRKLLWVGFPAMAGIAVCGNIGFAEGDTSSRFATECRRLEAASGGRLGVAMLNSESGARLGHRENERFAMCSTFKLLTVGAVLKRVDRGEEKLGRVVHYSKSELAIHSPATEAHVQQGMSIQELCVAAITLSDNTAANLLLTTIGGPQGFTRFARTLGDSLTRLDRNEPTLNEALPGDPRDTTSPAAMMKDMQAILLGDALSSDSKALLTQGLIANTTGNKALRAGVPKDWKVGDKTGSGDRGTTNDIGILWPPRLPSILVTVYLTGARVDAAGRYTTIAEVGKLVPTLLPE
jgi:beta-lactamase class A